VWRGETCLDTCPKRGITGLESVQQGGKEALRVVVLDIKGEPDGGQPTLAEKLGYEGSFAETGRGRDEDEALGETLLETLDETRAVYQLGRQSRNGEPGRQPRVQRLSGQGRGHRGSKGNARRLLSMGDDLRRRSRQRLLL
jgi:hypothetical protein